MATTSLSLGEHWETFIKERVAAGRFKSASEVIRESLRLLEEREMKIEALRAALIAGEESGPAGPLDIEEIKKLGRELKAERLKAERA